MSGFHADSVDPGAAGNGGPGRPGDHDKSASAGKSGNDEQPRIVIRDKRRIDPHAGEKRQPMESSVPEPQPDDSAETINDAEPDQQYAPEPAAESVPEQAESIPESANDEADERLSDVDRLTSELAERTNDLQRVNAEYANYRKRSEREREGLASIAQAALIAELLPVLDDIDRADQHGDLNGGFKNVADSLRAVLERAGLETFGTDGEPFDPSVHEAVAHTTSPDVESESVSGVMRRGYRQGDRVLRPAMVAVVAPE